jgi:hypothetical protein
MKPISNSVLIVATCFILSGVAPAFSQTPNLKQYLPPNTIDCSGFKKLPNGDWYASANNPKFSVGKSSITLKNSEFGYNGINIGGEDLASMLDIECGSGH